MNSISKYKSYYNGFVRYFYFYKILVKKDILKKYKNSYLGILWSLISPLLQMTVLAIIFSTLFNNSIENYPLYLISGRLIFDCFSHATNKSLSSIHGYAGMLKKAYFPKYILTMSVITSNFIMFLISLIDLVLVMLATHSVFTINLFYVPIFLFIYFVFIMGVGLVLATLATFFRDLVHIYGILVMILMYFSAIFYPASIIPQKYSIILWLNPMFQFVDGFRQLVYRGLPPDWTNLIYCICVAFVAIVVGIIVFEKNQDRFIFHL